MYNFDEETSYYLVTERKRNCKKNDVIFMLISLNMYDLTCRARNMHVAGLNHSLA